MSAIVFANASHDDQRCARCGRPAPRSNIVWLCTVCLLCVAAHAMQTFEGEKRRAWRRVRLDRTKEWYFERERWLN